jgi:DGQHR domain-containing protein
MYVISMKVEELIDHTTVAYYDSNNPEDDGYQRPLVPSHYRKIAKYFQMQSEPILPPAILTAADPGSIEEDGVLLSIGGKLRVVDGQHRIEGIRYLKKVDITSFGKIEEYQFPVIIMIIKPEQKVHEIETFININSKGKKVSTDLAIQLRDKIRDKQKINFEDNMQLIEATKTKVSNFLNKKIDSIWYESIRVGDEFSKGRPISINAFNDSLDTLVSSYIEYHNVKDIIKLDNIVEDLAELITNAWELIIIKWKNCFMNAGRRSYSKQFNIQKGIGVIPLHTILGEKVKEANGDMDTALNNFNEVLKISRVKSNDWVVGGKFSALNSRVGFQLLIKYLKNEDVEEDIKRMSWSPF